MPADSRDALDPLRRSAVEHLVQEALACLDDDELDAAEASLREASELAPHHGPVFAAQGELAWARGDLDGARDWLRRAVDRDPLLADAHYALARLHEQAGEHARAVAHDRHVLRLDAAADRRAGVGGRRDLARIEARARQTLDDLPERFASRLAEIAVVLEPRPSLGLVEDGFDPRAFGLFEGPDDHGRHGEVVADRPTRIVIFYANLLAAFPDPEQCLEQVEITLLHEIGHYFGLDEDQVDALGLG